MPAPTPLLDRVLAAAHGAPPAVDGLVEALPAPAGVVAAIVGFTGHHVVAADVPADWVARYCAPWDLEAPFGPRFVAALAERLDARVGSLDLLLLAQNPRRDLPPIDLVPMDAAAAGEWLRGSPHPRHESRVYRSPDGLGTVAVGRGVDDRWELSLSVEEAGRGKGIGRRLAAAARRLVDPTEPVFAQVAPGNVASVRAVLAAGYRPIGAELLFLPAAAATSA